MKVDVKNAEKLFKQALILLKGKCPEISENCDWCKLITADNV